VRRAVNILKLYISAARDRQFKYFEINLGSARDSQLKYCGLQNI
jgi:hypothetical protein